MAGHDLCCLVLFILTMNKHPYSIHNLLQCLTVANLLVGKVFIDIITWNQHCPTPSSWIYQSLTKHSFLTHCKYALDTVKPLSIVTTFPVFCKFWLMQSISPTVFPVFKQFWSKLNWPIFSLHKLNMEQYWYTFYELAIAGCVVLVTKRMRLPWHTCPTWTIFIQPCFHWCMISNLDHNFPCSGCWMLWSFGVHHGSNCCFEVVEYWWIGQLA